MLLHGCGDSFCTVLERPACGCCLVLSVLGVLGGVALLAARLPRQLQANTGMLVHALALNPYSHAHSAGWGLIRAGRRHARFASGLWLALWFRHQQWVLCLATLHYL